MTSDLSIRGRALALVLVLIAAVGLSAGVLGAENAVAAAFGVVAASVAIGVVPGALMILAWRARPDFTLLELVGAGVAVSFGLVQLMTMLMMTLHRSAGDALIIIGLVAIGHGLLAARTTGTAIRVPRAQVALGIAIAVVAGCLYVVGARYESTEDAIHVAIVRRLTVLTRPALDNIYFLPGFVYTYPFPGTHYFMALVSRASDLDPLFVYHKLRVLWGSAALVLLYACARRLFQSERLAIASALVATALTANGSFSVVSGYYWGQLAPFSHASDVAMGVLLPALLLGTLWTLQAETRRELVVAAGTALGMLLMLVIVHIREAVQLAVYLLAFAIALVVTRRNGVALRRTLALLAVTICGTVAYNAWNAGVASNLADLVVRQRVALLELVERLSLADAATPGLTLMAGYMPGFNMFFYGWNPIVLLAGGVALWRLRARSFVLLIAASIVSYVVIVRFVPLTAAYVYSTYSEILFTPVRNVIFFVHILAGVALYTAAAAIASRTRWVAVLLTVAAVGALGVAYQRLGGVMDRHNDLLWVPLLLIYGGATLLVAFRPNHSASAPPLDVGQSRGAWAVMTVLLASMLWVSWNPEASPLAGLRGNTIATPAAMLATRPCHEQRDYELPDRAPGAAAVRIDTVLSCRPPAGLVAFAHAVLPVDAVLAVDRFDEFPPSMYVPQQMDVWPGSGDGLVDPRSLFAAYYRFYDATVAKYGDQPLFNTRETRDERIAFLEGLAVTHVLVNPRNYATIAPALAADPDRFSQLYDEGGWAVYAVRR